MVTSVYQVRQYGEKLISTVGCCAVSRQKKRFCFSVGICITPRFLSEKGDRFSLRACPATLIIMVSLKGGKYGKSTVYDFRCCSTCKCRIHVLRYWEEELELTVPRNEMGHRYYTKENIEQFMKIKEWKEQGYQLKAIKAFNT